MARTSTDTKSRILRAARMLYSTHGCDGTTLDDIITASGITKGAFYHYFKSKNSLCEQILDEVMVEYEQLTESISGEAEPVERLRQLIDKLARLNSSGEWINCRLILRLSADSHEANPKIQRKIREFWQWYSGFFEELIEQCRTAGQFNSKLDAKTQTRLLMSLLAGAITLERIAPSESNFTELAETIIQTLQA